MSPRAPRAPRSAPICRSSTSKPGSDDALEARALDEKLERILSLFHHRPLEYAEVMRAAIALNGSFFNAQRMVSQYVENAYLARPSSSA